MIETISIQGFRSFNTKQEFNFLDHQGFILVTGKNDVDPKLGANGTGKSTLFEAITWCFFGKTSTNLKAGDIKNWTSNLPCEVEVSFTDGTILKRTYSPNSLTKNGNTITQEELNTYIKLNFESFIYSIFISQFGAKFVDLLPSEKMNIFTYIMDDVLGNWIKYSDYSKTKTDEIESEINIGEKQVASIEGSISSVNINEIQGKLKLWDIEQKVKIDEIIENISKLTDSLKEYDLEKDEKCVKILKEKVDMIQTSYNERKMHQDAIKEKLTAILRQQVTVESKLEVEKANKDLNMTIEVPKIPLEDLEIGLKYNIAKIESINKLLVEDKTKLNEYITKKSELKGLYKVESRELENLQNLQRLGLCPTCKQPTLDTINTQQNIETVSKLLADIHSTEDIIIEREVSINFLESDLIERKQEKDQIELDIKKYNDYILIKDNLDKFIQNIEKLLREKILLDDQSDTLLIEKNAIDEHLKQIQEQLKNATETYQEFYNDVIKTKFQIDNINKEIISYQTQLGKLSTEQNPFAEYLEESLKRLEILNNTLLIEQDALLVNKKLYEIYKYWVKGFKEIRLMLLSEALMDLEIHINNNIQKLGLENWVISLNVDSENKSGTIRKGFSVLVKSPFNDNLVPFECWSGGEGQRIRIAITLGISDFIKDKRGLDYNFIVLDEPTQYLSEEGINDLLMCLKEKSNLEGINTYLIDHRELETSGIFDEVITIQKNSSGSSINYG